MITICLLTATLNLTCIIIIALHVACVMHDFLLACNKELIHQSFLQNILCFCKALFPSVKTGLLPSCIDVSGSEKVD